MCYQPSCWPMASNLSSKLKPVLSVLEPEIQIREIMNAILKPPSVWNCLKTDYSNPRIGAHCLGFMLQGRSIISMHIWYQFQYCAGTFRKLAKTREWVLMTRNIAKPCPWLHNMMTKAYDIWSLEFSVFPCHRHSTLMGLDITAVRDANHEMWQTKGYLGNRKYLESQSPHQVPFESSGIAGQMARAYLGVDRDTNQCVWC